jgi:drug/metabolite transporter (DMT)-like permease
MGAQAGVGSALAAAILFGASTPLAKALIGAIPPVMLAGLLYLGSGMGLMVWLVLRRAMSAEKAPRHERLTRRDGLWLTGAILIGGIAAPVLLMVGLASTPASSVSLLLNLEGVFSALLAWFLFRENFDRRVLLGVGFIMLGGVMLAWAGSPQTEVSWGALAVVAACLCWAIDNNLTRKVSDHDPVAIAGIKGLAAGLVNLALAAAAGRHWPGWQPMLAAGAVGFLGYGVSLVLFVLALRHLGTARTGAYFSVAPFVGAALSLGLLGEPPTAGFWAAGALMGLGTWLHLTERHVHLHRHEALRHSHWHRHDEHHGHVHDPEWDGHGGHAHPHEHALLAHAHPHYPDTHHRHGHATDAGAT